MTLSLTAELLATGVASPEDKIEELHRTDGPIVITGCCRVSGRYTWLEHDRDGRLVTAPVARALAAIRAVASDPWIAVPFISEQGTAVYDELCGSQLLVDPLMPDQHLDGDIAHGLEPVFARLGELLAGLHTARPGPVVVRPLLRSHPGIDEVRRLLERGRDCIQPTLALEQLQECLLCEHPDLVLALRGACLTWDRCPASSIIHGAFSPAYVALAEGEPQTHGLRVLGWYDAAFGPPTLDAGWLLGELRELAEARDVASAEPLRRLGHVFATWRSPPTCGGQIPAVRSPRRYARQRASSRRCIRHDDPGVCRREQAFWARRVLHDLVLEVRPGTVMGFIGPNGAGKTTALRILLGLIAPDREYATVGGRPYRRLRDPVTVVGAAVQGQGFYPGRTARQHLRILATAAARGMDRVDELLASVDLMDAAHQSVGEFSAGMRSRLLLAGALIGRPTALVLDEPGNGLDRARVRRLRELLRDHADRGASGP